MGFIDRFKSRGTASSPARPSAPSPFDDMPQALPDIDDAVDTRADDSRPGSPGAPARPADSSIISEAAPSELGTGFQDTRSNGEIAAASAVGVLPLIGDRSLE